VTSETTEPGIPAGTVRAGTVPAGTLPADLAACHDAEDWFRALDVGYDPTVLDVGRLHVLRLFGRELQQLGESADLPTDDAQLRTAHRAALERAYRALVTAGPLEHRVFKVLRDRAPGQFVPLDDVRLERRIDDSTHVHEVRRTGSAGSDE
jgi:nitrogenase-stabilizing/protective protein